MRIQGATRTGLIATTRHFYPQVYTMLGNGAAAPPWNVASDSAGSTSTVGVGRHLGLYHLTVVMLCAVIIWNLDDAAHVGMLTAHWFNKNKYSCSAAAHWQVLAVALD
jgi:hypothetical protein